MTTFRLMSETLGPAGFTPTRENGSAILARLEDMLLNREVQKDRLPPFVRYDQRIQSCSECVLGHWSDFWIVVSNAAWIRASRKGVSDGSVDVFNLRTVQWVYPVAVS